MVAILHSIGCQTTWEGDNTIRLQRPPVLDVEALNGKVAKGTRAIVLLIAGLTLGHAVFDLPHPGGCSLGDRSLDPHIDVLARIGLHVCQQNNSLRVSRMDVVDFETTATLVESGDTVTENAILAAVARGRGSFGSAALVATTWCRIFVRSFKGCPALPLKGLAPLSTPGPTNYSILEDPIKAFFFMAAAVVTRGSLRILRVSIAFISLELRLLEKTGLDMQQGPQYPSTSGVTTLCDLEVFAESHSLKAPELEIQPNVYPFGINVDNLPAFGPVVAVSEGRTLLHEWLYEERASYFGLLEDFAVEVEFMDAHRAYIVGPAELIATDSRLPPALRPASMVLLAALAAPGTSCLDNVALLNRGYEDIVRKLRTMQALIEIQHADLSLLELGMAVKSVI